MHFKTNDEFIVCILRTESLIRNKTNFLNEPKTLMLIHTVKSKMPKLFTLCI